MTEKLFCLLGGLFVVFVAFFTGYQIVMYGPVWVKCIASAVIGMVILFVVFWTYTVMTWKHWG